MKSKTEKLLNLMRIFSWIVFIGLLIKAGSFVISYAVSIGNPEAAKDLYQGLDLYAYRMHNFSHYTLLVGSKIAFYIAQAYVAYLMINLLGKLNILKPFTIDVVKLMQKISYAIVGIWFIVIVHNAQIKMLENSDELVSTYISSDFIFISALVYIFAQMFKRGIEIQSENELTI